MGTLNLIERDSVLRPVARPGFWRRQFTSEVTRPQVIFDIVFGIVGPILCFAFDPIVFRGSFGDRPLFGDYKIYVYLFSGLEIMILSLWLLAGAGFQFWNEMVGAGLFLGGILPGNRCCPPAFQSCGTDVGNWDLRFRAFPDWNRLSAKWS